MYSINKEDIEFLYQHLSPTEAIPLTDLADKLPDYVTIMPCPFKGFYGINTLSNAVIYSDDDGRYACTHLAPNIGYVGSQGSSLPLYYLSYGYTPSVKDYSDYVVRQPFTLCPNGKNLKISYDTSILNVYAPYGRNIALPYGYIMESTDNSFIDKSLADVYGDTEGPNTLQIFYLPNTVTDVRQTFLTAVDEGTTQNKSKVLILTHNKFLYDNIIANSAPQYQIFSNPYMQFIPTSSTSATAANTYTISYLKKTNINYARDYKKFSIYTPTISAFASKFRPLLYLMTPQEKISYGIDPAEKQFLTWQQIKTLIAAKPQPKSYYQDVNYLCGRLSSAEYFVGDYCTYTYEVGNYNTLNTSYMVTIPSMRKPNLTKIISTFSNQNTYYFDKDGKYKSGSTRSCYKGSFIDAPNVTTLYSAYNGATGITGPCYPSPKCTNMDYAYKNTGVKGEAQIPSVLTSANYAYAYDRGITGVNGYDAPELINAIGMFLACTNLKMSKPLVTPKLVNMTSMYSACTNMTCTPRMYDNVYEADSAFFGCENIYGTPNFGENVVNVGRCYANCFNLTGPPKLPKRPCKQYMSFSSGSAGSISYYYGLYSNCYNLRGKPVTGEFVDNRMSYMYYCCHNLDGPPTCHKTVKYADYTYYGCDNMLGSPVVGYNVTSMIYMYGGCYKLTGRPVCPDSVTTAMGAYSGCSNLTGSVVLGANLIDMRSMYAGCSKLTGSPKCTENIMYMDNAFAYCTNLTGHPTFNSQVFSCVGAYRGCTNLTGGYIFPTENKHCSDISSLYSGCTNMSGGFENFKDASFSGADYTFAGDKITIPSTWKSMVEHANGMFASAVSASGSPISITIDWDMPCLNFASDMLYVHDGIVGGHLYLNRDISHLPYPSEYYDRISGKARCSFGSIRPYSNATTTQPPFYFHILRGSYFETYFREHFMQGLEIIEDGDGFHWADEQLQIYIKYY